MKFFMITSAAVLTLMSSARAQVLPDQAEVGILPNSYSECLEWAGADDSRTTLCDALQSCERDNSDTKYTLIDCITDAKAAFHQSKNPSLSASEGQSYIGEKIAVSTDESDSLYERRPDQKGWKDAWQGN